MALGADGGVSTGGKVRGRRGGGESLGLGDGLVGGGIRDGDGGESEGGHLALCSLKLGGGGGSSSGGFDLAGAIGDGVGKGGLRVCLWGLGVGFGFRLGLGYRSAGSALVVGVRRRALDCVRLFEDG